MKGNRIAFITSTMRTCFVLLTCFAGACCAQDSPRIGPQHTKPPAIPSIRGVVKAEGLRKEGYRVNVPFDGVPLDRTIDDRAVTESGEVQWALVQVVKWPTGASPPSAPEGAKISIKDHRFIPHVVGVGVDRPVTFINENKHLYVVQGDVRHSSEFHASVREKGDQLTQSFVGPPRIIQIKENVHPWMKAWVVLVPHGWFAVTDEYGRYEIKGLQPGSYVIEAWHQAFEPLRMNVKVSDGEPVNAKILLSTFR